MDSDAPLDRRCSAPFRRSLPFLHLISPIASVLAGFDIAHSVPCWTGISIASLALSLAVDDDGGGDEAKQRRAKSSALDIARFHLSCLIAAIGAALLTGLGVQSIIFDPQATFTWAIALSSTSFAPLASRWRLAPIARRHRFLACGCRAARADWLAIAPHAFAAIGSWLGCYVIPLDMGQPWQIWPLPCLFGCYFGVAAGILFQLVAWLFERL